ncbi:type IX secretion system protein PorQ [Flavobacterium oreochromis]|uniref:Type IX secretion system protein PorQ n=1 Tax=Flavobacterium oreochromis TaxID=2906078 RepID=A0ABW8P6A3_9FLAO|nr:type IX secretion system protein PorQ [Flavobacterium oreochromis]OWP77779.1 penicillin-binding protein [Flavobacterium oreochromis]QYS85737.1 type IX secretion system protein PorQ [Flavobacterium oreochromis]
MRPKFLLLIFIFSLPTYSQIGGDGVYRFLNLNTSPRQAALGGKAITIYDDDVNQPMLNPASINQEMDGKLGLNYASYLGDINYGTVSYAFTYDRHIQTFYTGISYINYGTFDGRDELGNQTGAFTANELVMSFGYAYNIPRSDLYLGANAKVVTSFLEHYQSFGLATDIGINYLDQENAVNYALLVKNFGNQIITYNGIQEKMPFEVMLGISKKLEHLPIRWHLTLDNLQKWQLAFSNPARSEKMLDGVVKEEEVGFLGNAMRHVILGAEILPDKGINFRISYNFRRAAELKILEQRTFAGFSVGVGIRFSKFLFDYSYSRYTLASNTSMFGLTINL